MPRQDGHWLASFEVIPAPPKVIFSAAKKKSRDAHPLLKKNLRPKLKLKFVFLLYFIGCFVGLTRRCPESPVQRCAAVVHTMFNTTSGGGVEHVQHHF